MRNLIISKPPSSPAPQVAESNTTLTSEAEVKRDFLAGEIDQRLFKGMHR